MGTRALDPATGPRLEQQQQQQRRQVAAARPALSMLGECAAGQQLRASLGARRPGAVVCYVYCSLYRQSSALLAAHVVAKPICGMPQLAYAPALLLLLLLLLLLPAATCPMAFMRMSC